MAQGTNSWGESARTHRYLFRNNPHRDSFISLLAAPDSLFNDIAGGEERVLVVTGNHSAIP